MNPQNTLDLMNEEVRKELWKKQDEKIMQSVRKDGDPMRGLGYALFFGTIMWVIIIVVIVAVVRCCNRKPVYESVGPIPVSTNIKPLLFEVKAIDGTATPTINLNAGKQ